jgi:hypothetical protein
MIRLCNSIKTISLICLFVCLNLTRKILIKMLAGTMQWTSFSYVAFCSNHCDRHIYLNKLLLAITIHNFIHLNRELMRGQSIIIFRHLDLPVSVNIPEPWRQRHLYLYMWHPTVVVFCSCLLLNKVHESLLESIWCSFHFWNGVLLCCLELLGSSDSPASASWVWAQLHHAFFSSVYLLKF